MNVDNRGVFEMRNKVGFESERYRSPLKTQGKQSGIGFVLYFDHMLIQSRVWFTTTVYVVNTVFAEAWRGQWRRHNVSYPESLLAFSLHLVEDRSSLAQLETACAWARSSVNTINGRKNLLFAGV